MATRWGLLGAGKICHDFVTAVRSIPKFESDHQFVAVATGKIEEAESFAKVHGVPKFHGSFKEVAENPDVDIVYVGVINPCHYDAAKQMLDAGKNVFVEKPFCMNLKQTSRLIKLAKEKKVFMMEGMWGRFMPSYQQLRKELASCSIGEVRYVQANFGQILTAERIVKKHLGGGTILDIGGYCINAALFAFGAEMPQKIKAVGKLNDDGVDVAMSAILQFSGGRLATISTSGEAAYPCDMDIVGTKGKLKVPFPMWCATQVITAEKTYNFPLPPMIRPMNFINTAGLQYEAIEVRKCLQQGLLECPTMPLADTEIQCHIMDEIRSQIGVVYPADSELN